MPDAGLGGIAVLTFLALFPIINPFGALPLFVSLTQGYSKPDLHTAELRIALYVVGILLFFMLLGPFVLKFFGISLGVLKIAGGLIVANTAWAMATGVNRMTAAEHLEAAGKADVTFSPMAMPMLSGPGSIGVMMGLAAHGHSADYFFGLSTGVVAIGVATYALLRSSGALAAKLGATTLGAINRIFGFLILAIAVQLIWNGVQDLRAA